MSLVPRNWSGIGLALAAAGALYLTQSGSPVFEVLPGEALVPAALVVVGAVVAAYGLLQANPGASLAGAGLVVAGPSLVRLGLPNPLEWVAALGGAAGLLLFVEPLLVADRARELRDRLEQAGEAGSGADPDVLAERTVELRMSQVRKTLVLSAGLVAGGVLAGTVLAAALPDPYGASLELDSLYGAVLWVGLGIGAVAGLQIVRGRDEAEDEA
jgi:hypothetical protein